MGSRSDKLQCKRPSSFRLRLLMKAIAAVGAGKINITGEDNLDRIPPGSRVIFVTTHITDFDLPLAFHVLADRFNIAITHISAHKMPTQYPMAYLWEEIGGRKNFIPIDYKKVDGRWVPAPFNPENFAMMKSEMERGKAIMISAHKPCSVPVMPDKPGIGAVYLAQITPKSVIVPIAVDIKSANKATGMAGFKSMILTVLHRPSIKVTIGKPTKIKPLVDHKKHIDTQKVKLVKQQGEIMQELAKGLPYEKAGIWAVS